MTTFFASITLITLPLSPLYRLFCLGGTLSDQRLAADWYTFSLANTYRSYQNNQYAYLVQYKQNADSVKPSFIFPSLIHSLNSISVSSKAFSMPSYIG